MDDGKTANPTGQTVKAWERLVLALEQELGADVAAKWIKPIRIKKFDAANLYLEVGGPMEIAWFEEHIRPRIKTGFLNENYRPIRVYVDQATEKAKPQAWKTPSQLPFSPSTIDPTHTFDQFLKRPANQMAAELIGEWIQKGTCPFNPLFLYGPKGSGKTHLLMSIAANFAAKKKVFYVTADTFTEHVVQAIRSGRMQEFRNLYRDIDLLLVDDVHQLGGRGATQEEFFHTFNTLHTLGKQIVLSAAELPSKLEEIEPRLISRFEWGIALGLHVVEPLALLKQKAICWNLSLKEELATWLVEHFPRDPLAPLQALSMRAPNLEHLSLEAAAALLTDLEMAQALQALTPELVTKALSTHFGVKPDDLLGKSQTKECTLPRQLAMYICRHTLKMPFQAIGKFFGGRDHSTVMSSVKGIETLVTEKNAKILEAIEIASKIR